ncbi:hypothetical protein ARTHRO8AJ_40087 [Arthrobacter sp. 8AJ]|nr:hypothetical protein ARTHRO8AJ_40087 [Arthrobacter sp. 8AJ]
MGAVGVGPVASQPRPDGSALVGFRALAVEARAGVAVFRCFLFRLALTHSGSFPWGL